MKITSEKILALQELPVDHRKFACEQDFLLFFAYYFTQYVKYPFASFHEDMSDDLRDLTPPSDTIRELAWVMMRESSKTSFAKAYVVYCIAYRKFKYINVDAYERDNSERFLFDVVITLQTNRRLRADFGELFNAPKSPGEKQAKRVSDFVTSNGIRVEAHTTQESIRGRLHVEQRPDLVVIDDYETLNTVRSEAATKQVREHFSELKGGIDQKTGRILYLSNYLSDFGNVASICERASIDHKLRVRRAFIYREDGSPIWPERHVLTDDGLKDSPGKTSIESLRRSMRQADTGDIDFEREYVGNVIDPMGDGPDKQGFLPLFRTVNYTHDHAPTNGPYVIGVDPGGDGSDETVIAVRSAFSAGIYATEKKSTGKSVAKLTLDAMKEYNVPAHNVVIDSFGVGFKALQELSILGHRVNAVNVGEIQDSLFDKTGFLNDRAFGFFRMRDWMAQGGQLCEHPAWEQELRSIRFIIDGKNIRRIIPKKEIIKRGYKSPNAVDATMMTFLIEMPMVNGETPRDYIPEVTDSPF